MSRASDEIIKHILLIGQITILMPFFAILATSTQIRHGDDPPLVKPDAPPDIKVRGHADAITAIASEQEGITAIQLGPFQPDDI